jgi:hypothetical protein
MRRPWKYALLAVGVTLVLLGNEACAEINQTQLDEHALIIHGNRERALKTTEKSIGLFDLALNNVKRMEALQNAYDDFFVRSTVCRSHPIERISAYVLRINHNDLDAFLKSDFVKEMPKGARSKLEILKWSPPQQETVFSDTYAQMFDADGKERFEIGHVIIKVFREQQTDHILILAPFLAGAAPEGCYDSGFRSSFVGKSQNIQGILAVKAAMSISFIESLSSFKPNLSSNELERLGFHPSVAANEESVVYLAEFGPPVVNGYWKVVLQFAELVNRTAHRINVFLDHITKNASKNPAVTVVLCLVVASILLKLDPFRSI